MPGLEEEQRMKQHQVFATRGRLQVLPEFCSSSSPDVRRGWNVWWAAALESENLEVHASRILRHTQQKQAGVATLEPAY